MQRTDYIDEERANIAPHTEHGHHTDYGTPHGQERKEKEWREYYERHGKDEENKKRRTKTDENNNKQQRAESNRLCWYIYANGIWWIYDKTLLYKLCDIFKW